MWVRRWGRGSNENGDPKVAALPIAVENSDGTLREHDDVESSVYARTLAADVVVDGEVVVPAGTDLGA